ncbi:MAG: pyruvate ferredoxin oxidoreductase [Chromatiaceae bacterium]|nr:pyruvate ferredoxin oxidoreductase [Gammaproteobacteria bacterium]MCB1904916.1 pyruvate ferredoxin oxidoreductase [Gammaproteobacteria bacterium]MCP5448908.1 pyruvate ferredoxin oxidoreductase [Chromatiaceae bacterium]
MLKQIEGSQAVAQAVALSRPEVISAYPITPQTHIVEDLGLMVKSGELSPCEFLLVESEFGALSACIGSSAAGARSYTATSSQGMLFMMEAVYNASGMGLPIVMTVGNRAIGAPINIWNDWSDSMSARDAGWIQLFVETNQEAVDVHIQAFRLAEELSMPVMVCMDGFILTHSYSQVDIPSQELVDSYLPPFQPRQVLDPLAPVSMGAMVGPEAFTEVRYLAHHKQRLALKLITEHADEFGRLTGRDSGGLLKEYDCAGKETVIVTMGSVIGTMKEVLAEMRAEGHSIGALTVRSFRPFPIEALQEALKDAKRVIVFEKSLAVGMGGILANDIRMATRGLHLTVHSVIGGLGGRPITRTNLRRMFEKGLNDQLNRIHFHDMRMDIVNRELDREKAQRRSGSAAENILSDVGLVAAAKTI